MTYDAAITAYNLRIDDRAFCARVGKLQERFMQAGKSLDDAFATAVDLAVKTTFAP